MKLSETYSANKQKLSQFLIDNGFNEAVVSEMKRAELVNEARNVLNSASVMEAVTETEESIIPSCPDEPIQLIQEDIVDESKSNEISPIPLGEACWHDYIMSQFEDDELVNGRPNIHGLRRMFDEHVGTIIETDILPIGLPSEDNRFTSTVKCKIAYVSKTGEVIRLSDAADAGHINTKLPFANFPTAVAATMAESRVYRKALRLKTIAAEETDSSEPTTAKTPEVNEGDMPAKSTQKIVISTLCKMTSIDSDKLIKSQGLNKTIEEITFSEAQKLIRLLNLYQRGSNQGGTDAPEEIKITQ